MIKSIDRSISQKLLEDAVASFPNIDFKFTLNKPTGNFFYDPWEIDPEFKNTVWEDILGSLPGPLGEARLIKLTPGTCYWAHADIDDRWHLSLTNENSYLIDLSTEQMYKTVPGMWYHMDAGGSHSAANFGETDRIQLVVRQLLTAGTFTDATGIIIPIPKIDNARYLFDKIYSPWLNRENKAGNIRNFAFTDNEVTFTVNSSCLDTLAPTEQFTVIRHW
jgi:hypothetical protein